MSEIVLIAALDRNGVIGAGGELPWRLPDDLRQFKRRTMGRPVIMGRRTWESLPRPLAGRLNVVVTRQLGYRAEGAEAAPSLEVALARARAEGAPEVFVIGGAAVFEEALPLADRMVLTHVDAEVEGDVYFPPLDPAQWVIEAQDELHPPDARHAFPFRVVVYARTDPHP